MKKVIASAVMAVLTIIGMGMVTMISPAHAETIICPDGQPPKKSTGKGYEDCQSDASGNGGQGLTQTGIFANKDMMNTLNTVLNVIVGLVGFVAVAVMILGGISFATSQGDTAKTARAKNMIIFGLVGLIVALLAFAIVNFVLTNVFKSQTTTS